VVLYAATEGVSPFRRSNTPATLQSVLNATPAPPASASGPLAELITGLLHKDPLRRPSAARTRELLSEAANPPAPVAAAAPTQPLQVAGRGIRIGRKTLLGVGAGVVAAAVAAYLVLADPFAGPLPDGWKKQASPGLGVTLGVPASYEVNRPKKDDSDKNWVSYIDPSGAIWVGVNLSRKSDDSLNDIKNSAASQMYADNERFKSDGEYDLGMPEGPKTKTNGNLTYQGRPAAENTVVYTTDDSQNPRPRELQIWYYRTKSGDMYKVTVSYPGRGDFTARGREVAKTALANIDIAKP
jgi:hypothetical protein